MFAVTQHIYILHKTFMFEGLGQRKKWFNLGQAPNNILEKKRLLQLLQVPFFKLWLSDRHNSKKQIFINFIVCMVWPKKEVFTFWKRSASNFAYQKNTSRPSPKKGSVCGCMKLNIKIPEEKQDLPSLHVILIPFTDESSLVAPCCGSTFKEKPTRYSPFGQLFHSLQVPKRLGPLLQKGKKCCCDKLQSIVLHFF